MVRSSHSVRLRTDVDLLVESLLRLEQLFAGLVLGLLGFLGELFVKRFHLLLDHVEPAMHGPFPPQPDERLVAGQNVHAVEHER